MSYLLNIQMDHIPMSLQMSGSLEGKTRLKDRAPPASMEAYAWTSKMVYRVDPGTAGFLLAVDALGANVAAVFCTACSRRDTHSIS
jgi:hypothetical protein